jgi:limonene-1,2-epoxide hydrolase
MSAGNDSDRGLTRGRFLFTGLAAGLGCASGGEAAEPTEAEKANLALVTSYCESFSTRDISRVASFMAPNCSYRITEAAMPLIGQAALDRIKKYLEEANSVNFKIFDSWARGPVVVNQRVDTFVLPQRTNEYRLIGVFFVKEGKIAEWTDFMIR